jgi:hypothetical protein
MRPPQARVTSADADEGLSPPPQFTGVSGPIPDFLEF